MFKYSKLLIILVLLVTAIVIGCSDKEESPAAITTTPAVETNTSNHVTLDLGEKRVLVTQSVSTTDEVVSFNDVGHVLDGLNLKIPADSYAEDTNVTIAYRPIEDVSDNSNFHPASPLIIIDNGGAYANEVMELTIPVEMEAGYHYMAFYYDEANGTLEGIPEVRHDEHSITILTRHFSDIVLNRLGVALILNDFASSFKVELDGWPFINYGSIVSPDGACGGMSVTALYYHKEKKRKLHKSNLYTSYNNGTTELTIDDDQAIKLCSVVQNSIDFEKLEEWMEIERQRGDLFTYLMFSHALLLTGEPQYVSIFPDDGSDGHMMLVYKKYNNSFFVYDPNMPGESSSHIDFKFDPENNETTFSGSFDPYTARWNAGAAEVDFTKIYYSGQSALVDNSLDALWRDLDAGHMNSHIMEYNLDGKYEVTEIDLNEQGDLELGRERVLRDDFTTSKPVVELKINTDFKARIFVYHDGELLLTEGSSPNEIYAADNGTDSLIVFLNPGDNKVGINVQIYKDGRWTWADFKYFNIVQNDTYVAVESADDQVLNHGWLTWPEPEVCPRTSNSDDEVCIRGNGCNEAVACEGCSYHSICLYRDNMLSMEDMIHNSRREGIVKTYYTNGQLGSEVPYTVGMKDGDNYTYYRSGKLNRMAHYTHNILNGVIKIFYESTGTLKDMETVVNGQLEGEHFNYYESGILHIKGMFSGGKKEGMAQVFFESGALATKVNYTNNKENGVLTGYYDSGNNETGPVHYTIDYVNGVEEGASKYYNADGIMISCWNYIGGVKIDSCMQ